MESASLCALLPSAARRPAVACPAPPDGGALVIWPLFTQQAQQHDESMAAAWTHFCAVYIKPVNTFAGRL